MEDIEDIEGRLAARTRALDQNRLRWLIQRWAPALVRTQVVVVHLLFGAHVLLLLVAVVVAAVGARTLAAVEFDPLRHPAAFAAPLLFASPSIHEVAPCMFQIGSARVGKECV